MTHLARILKSNNWASVDAKLTLDSPPDLLNDVCDLKGASASYWAIDYIDRDSLSRFSAAMATVWRDLGKQQIGIISIDVVKGLGIEIAHSKGRDVSDVDFCDNFHRDLKILNLKLAFKLAQKISENIIILSATDVKAAFKLAIDQSRFTVQNLNPEFQKKLAKDGCLKINF
ncbi:hypothetical protein FE249_00805 [Acidiphilium multivorum]|uniref:hypothetical protein n=1 Tax=Acidiphilium multivorum TaxID=62140 RepID=UPI001F4BDD4E|nr:hypothetical protein [Acidiphilium multivorum]UNC12868.1 hypothetical protein FE249_00805 [Acidiphilium multivorum]